MEKVIADRTKPIFQGDVLLVPVDLVPDNQEIDQPLDGKFIVTHSETGHHHTVDAEKSILTKATRENPFICYLSCLETVDLVHHRSFDTHQTIELPPGNYRVHRQVVYTPQGLRKVQD